MYTLKQIIEWHNTFVYSLRLKKIKLGYFPSSAEIGFKVVMERTIEELEEAISKHAKKPIKDIHTEDKDLDQSLDYEHLITLNERVYNVLHTFMYHYFETKDMLGKYRNDTYLGPGSLLGLYTKELFLQMVSYSRQVRRLQKQITVLETELQITTVALKLKTTANKALSDKLERLEKEVERQLIFEQGPHAETDITQRETLLPRNSTGRTPRSFSLSARTSRKPMTELVPDQKIETELKHERSLEQSLILNESRIAMIERCLYEASTPEQIVANLRKLLPPTVRRAESKRPLMRFSPSLASTGLAAASPALTSTTSPKIAPSSTNLVLATPSSAFSMSSTASSASTSYTSAYSTSSPSASSSASSTSESSSSSISSQATARPTRRSLLSSSATMPSPTGPS